MTIVSVMTKSADLDTHQIRKLEHVFRRFGFSVDPVVCLNTKDEKPQNTLNLAIAQHIAKHDGANNLMIIYYTGHGLQLGSDGRLAFAATTDAHKVKRGKHHAIAYWDIAEELLFKKGVEPDVFTILDCCFASRGHKGSDDSRRIYDLLAACDRDETTPAPCPTSFTERLVATLEKFLNDPDDQSILTTKLLEEINKDCDSPAYLFDRLKKNDNRHVQLKPLSEQTTEEAKELAIKFKNQPPEEAGVSLRFSLQKQDLSKKKIEEWAQALITACETVVPLRRIDWVKMEKNSPGQRLQRLVDIVHQAKNNPRQRFRKAIETVIENNETAARRANKRSRSEDPLPVTSKRRASGNLLTPFIGLNPGPMTPESNAGS
ncbi:hypothetical protein BU25DRAFT_98040 [Macroventuria anomochaeta]|uniref:Uncharacterized protein n=1 Tax=Macroventuria anomochaeta TaxID=301207 RepID=A0ACB6RWV8_9PLEO|nr:uncharacterized protein BU25DRAFT_98040 [Macroventuria anomochaeta]KAF2626411.1 hypothetical protein BU25DRAFT_98040 [Macroventuria anomochaeta]